MALDLRRDVERRLALPGAAVVAGDDEITDLASEFVVDAGAGQPGDLLGGIEFRLSAPPAPRVARLDHLTDLLVALRVGHRGGGAAT